METNVGAIYERRIAARVEKKGLQDGCLTMMCVGNDKKAGGGDEDV